MTLRLFKGVAFVALGAASPVLLQSMPMMAILQTILLVGLGLMLIVKELSTAKGDRA
jgi:hypothetical protein